MKKICTFLLCCAISTFSFAQKNESFLTEAYVLKGSWMLGGDLTTSWKSYSQDQGTIKNVDKGRVLDLQASGKIGYFLMEDFALGLKIKASHFNLKSDSTGAFPANTVLLAGPFIRKYFKAGIFGEAGAAIGLDHLAGGRQADMFSADLGLGYTHFLNHNIAIEPLIVMNYSRQQYGATAQTSYSEIGPEFRLGIQAFLFKPKLATPEK
jgi:hypothetical protein